MRDTKWASWTATLGWPVQGIWPPGADGTDINSCARSHSEDLVVSGDDFGQVKLMRFPCLDTRCGDKHYTGHAQHVMSTRFTFDDSHVLSTGGGDKCIFQWACHYEDSDDVEEDLGDASAVVVDELNIEHRTKLQEAGREGMDADGMAELFEQQQRAAGGGDEFMAVKPWLGTITRMKPKNFDMKSISNDAPDIDMDLHFVFGFRGNDCRNNLRYTAKGEVCYPAAALGVVYNRRDTQRFFDMHTDDVLSLAMHPQGKIVATGEIGRTPKIIVWDSDTCATLAVLKGFHKRGVPLLAFSGGRGDRLASVGLDDDHSIAVYAWEQKLCIATCKGAKSKILGLSFGKDLNSLVTCGVRHLTFWDIKGTTLKSQRGIFGSTKYMQTALSIGTMGKNTIVTGMANGNLYKWGKKNEDKIEVPHKLGEVKPGHDTAITAIWPHPDGLITGAKDGTIIMWNKKLEKKHTFNVSHMEWVLGDPTVAVQGKEKGGKQSSEVAASGNESSNMATTRSKNPSVQSICMKDGKLLIGTKGCEIIELDIKEINGKMEQPRGDEDKIIINTPMLHAHCKGETWGLAIHPDKDQFMTCGDDGTGRLWDAYDKYLKATVHFRKRVRACAFSPPVMKMPETECHAAFGLFDGYVMICRDDLKPIFPEKETSESAEEEGGKAKGKKKKKRSSKMDSSKVITKFKCCKEWIQDLKYSPKGDKLAVSSHDNRIYLVTIKLDEVSKLDDMYQKSHILECRGHSSYITHIDWSDDGKYLQSTCGAYELLFWDTSNPVGKKVNQAYASQIVDTTWQTFSVPLGWDVQGIWPPNVDGTDINAVERSHGKAGGKRSAALGNLIAIADDFGMVKLQRFPCISNSQIAKSYRGHSAHVTNVAFYNADDFLVSTGGGDNCIFLWKTDYVAGAEDEADEHSEGSQSRPHEEKLHAEIVTSLSNDDLLMQMALNVPGGGDEFMAVKPWLGAISEPSSWSPTPASFDEPSKDLDLKFVYGFSSHIRNSVFFDKHGSYVYVAAATGVVYDPNEHTQRFNRALTDDILSCSLSPDGNTCAMGERGRKPKICIWDVHSGNTLLTIGGFHRRGVNLLAWSPSGTMLATVGLDNDHSLAVYNTETGDLIASSKGHQSTVLDLLFKSESEIIIVGVKHAKFFTLNGRRLKGKKGIFGKKGKIQPILCVASLGTNVVTGQADGTLYLWQGRNCQMETEKAEQKSGELVGHKGPVTSIWTMAREGVVSGGRDGVVIIWDRTLTQLKRFPIATLKGSAPIAKLGSNLGGRERVVLPCGIQSICMRDNQILVATQSGTLITFSSDNEKVNESDTNRVIEGHFVGETWGLARHPTGDEFVTCGDDMTLRRWDSAHQRAIAVVKLDAKARAVDYAPDAAHIAVGLYSGRVEIFDGQLGECVKGISVCSEWIQDVKYSPFPGRRLAVSSHDNSIYIFDRKSYTRTAVLRGHSSYITHIDFSEDGRYLQSNCGAYELLFWDVDKGKQITSASSLRDVPWDTWTCTLGWPVQGIWPPEADGTDVNSVDRSPDKSLLVTADDFGKVKLFRYPAPRVKGSAFRTGEGHSSHVTNARFLANGKTIVTTGGNDRCMFQWDVIPAKVRSAKVGGKRRGGSSNPPAPQAKSSRRPRAPPKKSQRRRRRRKR
jgi:microtubule-associated protein-like 6